MQLKVSLYFHSSPSGDHLEFHKEFPAWRQSIVVETEFRTCLNFSLSRPPPPSPTPPLSTSSYNQECATNPETEEEEEVC